MPAGLCRLHHYISAWPAVRSAWGFIFYITALPFSPLLLSALLWLCPRTTSSLLCSSPCSPHFHLCSVEISLPTLPSEQFLLTHRRCQVELAGLHITQTACLLTSRPFKTPQLHCHARLREMKHTLCYVGHQTHVKRSFVNWHWLYTHTYWRMQHVNKCLCLDMEDPSVGFAGI